MKSDTVVGMALIAILTWYGCLMAGRTRILIHRPDVEQTFIDQNEKLQFETARGIDVSGNVVVAFRSPGAQRAIVFMLRGDNIQRDLTFWSTVSSLRSDTRGLTLIAYCDGKSCDDAVRLAVSDLPFPVIAFGEVTSSQALFNADAEGYGFVVNKGTGHSSKLGWRGESHTPQRVLVEATK